MSATSSPVFYGWRVVGGSFIAQLFVVGFFTYAASLLVAPVRQEFDVSLEQVMYGFTFGTLLGTVMTPVAGIMLDRYPARWLMTGGTLALGGGLYWLSASRGITEFALVFGATMALSNNFAGSMSASTVIARWFTASRGRALGLAAIGTSLGGVLLPKFVAEGIAMHGWRDTLEWLAIVVLVVMVPAVVLLVRGKPEEVGLGPEPDPAGEEVMEDAVHFTSGQVLRTSAFWFLSLSLGLLFSTYGSIVANLGPYALDRGYDESSASTLIMMVAASGFVGKLVFGALADKVNLKLALCVAQGLVLVGFLLLSLQPGYTVVLLATVFVGLAAGGMLPVWGALIARVFGLLSYGRVMGMMGPVITLCAMPGYTVVGRMYDASGSYVLALQIFAGVLVVAILLVLPIRLQRGAGAHAISGESNVNE